MEIVIAPDELAAANVVADVFEQHLRSGPTTLGLATGSSPLLSYAELIRRHRDEGLSFAEAGAFLLDEYVGLPRAHAQSYYSVIRAEFTDHVDLDPARVRSPNGEAEDVAAEAIAYDHAIAEAGGVDVQLLGIGTDGHIGFNEPISSLSSRTRVKTLTEQTLKDNARFFTGEEEVPRHVLTQGLGTIGEARHVVLVATGGAKAAAVAAMVEGPLAALSPASSLQLHPHATIVIDEAAAADLKLADYYRFALAHKPSWQGF